MHKDAEGYTSVRGSGVDPLHALTVMQFAKVTNESNSVVGGLMHKDEEGYTSVRRKHVDPLHVLTVMQFAKVVTATTYHIRA